MNCHKIKNETSYLQLSIFKKENHQQSPADSQQFLLHMLSEETYTRYLSIYPTIM